MIPLVSAAEMRAIDAAAIERYRVPSLELMESAGQAVVERMSTHFGSPSGRNVLVVCGGGNNGGDGLVVARRLQEDGARVTVIVAALAERMSPDAIAVAGRWTESGGEILHVADENAMKAFLEDCGDYDVVVDALLGTGSAGAPRGAVLAAIVGLNRLDIPIASIDIPSGIDPDTGAVAAEAVRADLTVALGYPKRGHYLHPAREHTGLLETADIGLPREAALAAPIADFLVEAEDVRELLPRWSAAAHKGSRGRLLLVGGSVGLTGAVVLAARAALRAGAGLVTAGVPQSLNDVFEIKLTEAMTLPLAEGGGRWLSPAALQAIRDFGGDRLSALIVGPGMSRQAEALEVARSLVTLFDCPAVIDADALYAFRGRPDLLERKATSGPLVLTPHPGEAEWILGVPPAGIEARRIDLAAEWGQRLGQVLVLKGSPTVIGTPEGEAFVNPTGGPALATGGTGDVLAGLIGAFLAQGLSPVHAAIVGVYLHGHIADLIVERRGRFGLVAGDLVDALPEALGELSGGAR